MTRAIRQTLAFALAGLVGSLATQARAGMISPCDDPIVLPGVPVQVYILPFHAEGSLTREGRQLATILQRHVLYAAIKYRYIGVEQLTGDPAICNFARASARIMPRLKDGQSAIFLWGRIFEQGGAIHLQSTVTFSRLGKADTLAWNVGAGDAGIATATTPGDPVMFATRLIPLEFLSTLKTAEEEARKLHSSPNMDAPSWELPDDPQARFSFQVVEVKDDWMHIQLLPGGKGGWVPAHALATAGNLKGAFPELYFIDGLVGYEQLFGSKNERPLAGDRKVLEMVRASFDQYISLTAGRAESEARALAAVLKGNAVLRAAGTGAWPPGALEDAQRYYGEARELAPSSTTANSFYLACTSALCARGTCPIGADQLHAAYLDAISRDPTSRELVDNLRVFYLAAKTGRLKIGLSAQDIAKRQEIVRQVQHAAH